jgi:hypothetical protein
MNTSQNKCAFVADQKLENLLLEIKKQDYQIPTSELKPSFINKQKIQKLIELDDKYEIYY